MAGPQIRFIDSLCVQDAVYWHPPKKDGYGSFTFEDVEEIKVRWDGKSEVNHTADGTEIVSKAEILIHSSVPELKEEGYLMLGSIADLTSVQKQNPEEIETAFPIMGIEMTPLFRSKTEFVRKVYL